MWPSQLRSEWKKLTRGTHGPAKEARQFHTSNAFCASFKDTKWAMLYLQAQLQRSARGCFQSPASGKSICGQSPGERLVERSKATNAGIAARYAAKCHQNTSTQCLSSSKQTPRGRPSATHHSKMCSPNRGCKPFPRNWLLNTNLFWGPQSGLCKKTGVLLLRAPFRCSRSEA